MRIYRASIFATIFLLSGIGTALAQTASPPFFSAGATGYEATVSTAFTGTPLSIGVNVSADHKYVGMGLTASNQGVPAFTPFTITAPAGVGFVGTTPAPPAAGAARPPINAAKSAPPPSLPATILDKPGMTLVASLAP